MKLTESTFRQFVILATLALIFSTAYIDNSVFNDGSSVANIATLNIGMPHRTRLLVPFVLYHTVPHYLLDSFRFRVGFSWAFSLLGLYTFPHFWERIVGKGVNRIFLSFVLFVMLFAHYAATRWDQVFYIYDIPMVVFSMWAFLLLTSASPKAVIFGGVATLIFSFGKETIVSAVAGAFAYWAHAWWRSSPRRLDKMINLPIVTMVFSGAAIILCRAVVTRLVGGGASDYASLLYEDGVFRIYANLQHVLHIHGALVGFLLWGCGLVIWLPIFWTRLNAVTRWMMVICAPPFVILLFVDNFIELRCYSELLPLMAVGFGQVLLTSAGRRPELATV